MRNNKNNKNTNNQNAGERPQSSLANNNIQNQLGSSLGPGGQIQEVPASENNRGRNVVSQDQSHRPSNQSGQANVPAYESSSSKKPNDPNGSDQIKDKELNERIDADGVPRTIHSRNGQLPNKAEPQINENESIGGAFSLDAPTQAFPRDQQSMYQSHKGSEVALRKDDERASPVPGRQLTKLTGTQKIKGMKVEEEILVKGAPGLPQPEEDNHASGRSSHVIGSGSQIFPEESDKPRSKWLKYCGCCCRSDDPEEVEIHLDNCGKHSIVAAFALMQIASVATLCLLYLQFFQRGCIFPIYQLTQPTIFGLQLDMEDVYKINAVVSICLKFASVVCLRIALDEYQELNSNCSCFVFAILFSLAPNALMAPMYTYDHTNCAPKNFLVTQGMAELGCAYSLFLISCPLALLIVLPNFLKKFCCCRKRKQAVVSESQEDLNKEIMERTLELKKSVSNRLSNCMMYFINFVVAILIIEMLFATLLIHLPTYRLFEGEFFASGGCNEFLSFIILLLLIFMFRSREITEKQIKQMISKHIRQQFRNSMLRRKSLQDSDKKAKEADKEQQNLLDARETDDKAQPETTRGKRNPHAIRQDSLEQESQISGGNFASAGPKIGFQAFNGVQLNTKDSKN